LHDPGIGVLLDAQIACKVGRVTAMHDPTEGGLANGLWELAQASGLSISIDLNKVHIPRLAAKVCELFQLNPFAAISSGALLIAVHPEDAGKVCRELLREGIDCTSIGQFNEGPPSILTNNAEHDALIALPMRDEIARLIDERLG
jgi:hydrogenase maturation factor